MLKSLVEGDIVARQVLVSDSDWLTGRGGVNPYKCGTEITTFHSFRFDRLLMIEPIETYYITTNIHMLASNFVPTSLIGWELFTLNCNCETRTFFPPTYPYATFNGSGESTDRQHVVQVHHGINLPI